MNEAFSDADEDKMVKYVDLVIYSQSYMDDIGNLSNDAESAQEVIDRIENLLETKVLDLNVDKTSYMVMGSKSARTKLRAELSKKPLKVYNKEMQEVNTVKYLGEYLCPSLEESVHQTIVKRIGIAKKSIFEIRTVVEDRRANQVGGFNLALDIWVGSIEPMLFYNSEMFVCMQSRTLKALDELYILLYRSLFRCSTGTPKVNYFWQLGTLTPANIILKRKLMFLFHLYNLPSQSLAREALEIMEHHQLPGLLSENSEHLEKLNFNINRYMSKYRFRKLVDDYIQMKCRKELLESMKNYKKICYDECVKEEFKRKQYFFTMNLSDIRYRFKVSSSMIDCFKADFSSKYKHESLVCQYCKAVNAQNGDDCDGQNNEPTNKGTEQPRDTLKHNLNTCPEFSDLRSQYDIETDIGIIQYFKAVADKRAEEQT